MEIKKSHCTSKKKYKNKEKFKLNLVFFENIEIQNNKNKSEKITKMKENRHKTRSNR